MTGEQFLVRHLHVKAAYGVTEENRCWLERAM